jgi:hypothetical protein
MSTIEKIESGNKRLVARYLHKGLSIVCVTEFLGKYTVNYYSQKERRMIGTPYDNFNLANKCAVATRNTLIDCITGLDKMKC